MRHMWVLFLACSLGVFLRGQGQETEVDIAILGNEDNPRVLPNINAMDIDVKLGQMMAYDDQWGTPEREVASQKIVDERVQYFDADKKLIAIYTLKEGKFEGLQETYFPGGKLRSKFSIHNGVPVGEAEDYYESGAIKLKTTYEKSTGLVAHLEGFHEKNGFKRYTRDYKDGKMHGWNRTWDAAGPIQFEILFRMAKRIKVISHKDMTLESTTQYEKDRAYLIKCFMTLSSAEIILKTRGMDPGKEDGLKALVDNKCLDKLGLDPWGHSYIYHTGVDSNGTIKLPTIISLGADGLEGGDGINTDFNSSDFIGDAEFDQIISESGLEKVAWPKRQ